MYQTRKRAELEAEIRRNKRRAIADGCLSVFLFIGAIVVLIGGLISVVEVPSYYSDKNECRYAQRNSGNETKFVKNHILSWDCYVKVDGKWIPIDKWRGVEGDN